MTGLLNWVFARPAKHEQENPSSPDSRMPSLIPASRSERSPSPSIRHSVVPEYLHIFVQEGSVYDTCGSYKPCDNTVRVVVSSRSFEAYDTDENMLRIMSLLHSGAKPAVDIACCSWTQNIEALPHRLTQFLEYVLSLDGTVRFSDFSLSAGISFLGHIGMPVDGMKLVGDINGLVDVKFNPAKIKDSGMDDLSIIGDVALGGRLQIKAMPGTMRMALSDVPDYATVLMTIDWKTEVNTPGLDYDDETTNDEVEGSTYPCLVSLQKPDMPGRVVLFSLHFGEIKGAMEIDADRLEKIIFNRLGEGEARRFRNGITLARNENDDEGVNTLLSQGLTNMILTSTPSR